MNVNRFEDLEIWKDARDLSKNIFILTNSENFKKDYRFRDQIRASSGSVMDNIAEGFERGGNKEFIQFLFIAKGSLGETRSQLYRALDFSHIAKEEFNIQYEIAIQLSQKIFRFIKYLQQSDLKGTKYH